MALEAMAQPYFLLVVLGFAATVLVLALLVGYLYRDLDKGRWLLDFCSRKPHCSTSRFIQASA